MPKNNPTNKDKKKTLLKEYHDKFLKTKEEKLLNKMKKDLYIYIALNALAALNARGGYDQPNVIMDYLKSQKELEEKKQNISSLDEIIKSLMINIESKKEMIKWQRQVGAVAGALGGGRDYSLDRMTSELNSLKRSLREKQETLKNIKESLRSSQEFENITYNALKLFLSSPDSVDASVDASVDDLVDDLVEASPFERAKKSFEAYDSFKEKLSKADEDIESEVDSQLVNEAIAYHVQTKTLTLEEAFNQSLKGMKESSKGYIEKRTNKDGKIPWWRRLFEKLLGWAGAVKREKKVSLAKEINDIDALPLASFEQQGIAQLRQNVEDRTQTFHTLLNKNETISGFNEQEIDRMLKKRNVIASGKLGDIIVSPLEDLRRLQEDLNSLPDASNENLSNTNRPS